MLINKKLHNMYTFIAILTYIFATLLLPANGNHEADIGFTCTIYQDDKPICTGTMISRMWVVTACLCVNHIPNTRIYIRIGDPYMKGTKKHRFYKADKIEIHPECVTINNEYRSENDVALIMLNEPFFDSKTVYIAKLPNHLMYWNPDTTEQCELASYTDLNDTANSLGGAVWQTKSSIQPPGKCEKHFKIRSFKRTKNTCASYWHKNGEKGCPRDVGTPLIYQFILVGVLAHKSDCGQQDDVASFVNIPLHAQWIRGTTLKHTPWILL